MVGAMALSYLTVELGWVVLGVGAFWSFQVVFGFMWLYAVLCVICPSGSAVPRQALRQMLVLCIGNFLCQNVAHSRNVRGKVCIVTIGLLTRPHRISSASSTPLSCSTRFERWGGFFSTKAATT